ncbi:hypothetical protein ISS03_01050 [Patescibacteria group bacterium]|nr:hypothetical protein [Patescibacteria group bacterium]
MKSQLVWDTINKGGKKHDHQVLVYETSIVHLEGGATQTLWASAPKDNLVVGIDGGEEYLHGGISKDGKAVFGKYPFFEDEDDVSGCGPSVEDRIAMQSALDEVRKNLS